MEKKPFPASNNFAIVHRSDGIHIFDDYGAEIATLPGHLYEDEAKCWAAGFEYGLHKGRQEGLADGVRSVQASLLSILGLSNTIHELGSDAYRLRQALLERGFISKEDARLSANVEE
ncbi:hypothetical protein LJC74_01135 [Eubacteriales bacterium OttesenSCG-928-A19]|nr:hypothetical protein [Eubacteriales bacterium OttesenSCG-928-A19]